jgi:hypothetical protein
MAKSNIEDRTHCKYNISTQSGKRYCSKSSIPSSCGKVKVCPGWYPTDALFNKELKAMVLERLRAKRKE